MRSHSSSAPTAGHSDLASVQEGRSDLPMTAPISKLPPLREDHHGVIPYAGPKLSLFQIEQEMAELIAVREECESDEERGVVDAQIQEYVGREIRKVSGIAALLKHFKSQAAIAKAEEERAAKWRKRWESSYERLKNMVHGVMMALDLPKVEGATDRFRRQKNPVSLEITDAKLIPEEYLKSKITMPFGHWKDLVKAADSRGSASFYALNSEQVTVTSEVDTAALKAALLVKIICADCKGSGGPFDLTEYGGGDKEPCPTCEGIGTVSATVPGARLTQSEHLRCE